MADVNVVANGEMHTGTRFGPLEWTCDDDTLDVLLSLHDQWFEPFAVGAAPYGTRLIPPVALLVPYLSLNPYTFRGIAAGIEHDNPAVMLIGEKYLFYLAVGEQYERRGRKYVWFDGEATDQAGSTVNRYRYLQVLSAVPETEQAAKVRPALDLSTVDIDAIEEHPYRPPPRVTRSKADWLRKAEFTELPSGYLRRSSPVGFELFPESARFAWRNTRDYAEYRAWLMPQGNPKQAAYNTHTNTQAAQEIGLEQPIVSAANLTPIVGNMLYRALGSGWLVGGQLSCRFIRPVHIEDYFTARGVVVGRHAASANHTRIELEVWGENQRGEKVIVGSASGLVPTEE